MNESLFIASVILVTSILGMSLGFTLGLVF